jgi:hypothetical protein
VKSTSANTTVSRALIVKACFSTNPISSHEQRNEQLDWLATNTDVITSQSQSLFACSRENRQLENKLYIQYERQ